MAVKYRKSASGKRAVDAGLQRNSGPGRPIKSVTELIKEYGTSGTKNFSGVLIEEYLAELSFYQAPITYDRMSRSDGTISALLNAYMMPLRAAKWYVEPYDDSPQALDMADFIHDNLWSFGNQTYDDFMREALSMFTYGFSWFEKIFDWIEQGTFAGKLGWHHFAFRYPQTRFRWNTNLVNTPGGVQHRRLTSITQLAPPDYKLIDIPVEKALIFALNKLGDNYDGISLLRAAYPHYKIKQILYHIQAVGLERAAMGIPYAKYLTQASPDVIAAITQILENLRIDDQASAQFDGNTVDIGFLVNKFDSVGIMAAIDHHDTKIMQSGLAQFVNLGTRSSGVTGSYALSQDQSEMFLDALNGEANSFSNSFNMQATQQLIRLNYGNSVPTLEMPRLRHGDIGERASIKLAQSLNAFAQYGFMTPDPHTENVIREFLDLPERDEDYREAIAEAALSQGVFQSGSAGVNPAGKPQQAKGALPGQPGAAGTGAGNSGSGNKGFANKGVAGAPRGAKGTTGLKASERDILQVEFFSELQSLKTTATTWTPQRPSIAAAQRRRPYVIRSLAE